MDNRVQITIDEASGQDKTAVCIRTHSRTAEVLAMAEKLRLEGIEVTIVETDVIVDIPDTLEILRTFILEEPPRHERFIDPHECRPFNSHPRSFRKRK